MTSPKLCIDCIHYHVPSSKEPCRDCLPQTVAVPKFKHKPSGWIKWSGGECPCPDDTVVSVEFRDGSIERNDLALFWEWIHYGEAGDIVAYKVER